VREESTQYIPLAYGSRYAVTQAGRSSGDATKQRRALVAYDKGAALANLVYPQMIYCTPERHRLPNGHARDRRFLRAVQLRVFSRPWRRLRGCGSGGTVSTVKTRRPAGVTFLAS